MADVVDSKTRSRMMAGIRGKNTRPELLIRRGLHALGFRFRLHDKRLPGKPDLVFPRRRAVILVHGCFWHGHSCHLFKWPTSRDQFWRQKIIRNRENDFRAEEELVRAGWRIGIVWECALKGRHRYSDEHVLRQLDRWLRGKRPLIEITGAYEARQAGEKR